MPQLEREELEFIETAVRYWLRDMLKFPQIFIQDNGDPQDPMDIEAVTMLFRKLVMMNNRNAAPDNPETE